MRIGSVAGVVIAVHELFLLLLAVLVWLGRGLEAAMVFLVVLLHELGHALAARTYGLRVREVELLPTGGVARLDELVELDPAVEGSIAAAGPLTNLVLVGLAALGARYRLIPAEWLDRFIQVNLALAVANLVPALPLDGGRMLRARLSARLGFRRATEAAVRWSRWLALLGLVAGAVGFYLGYMNASGMLLALFVYVGAGREEAMAGYAFIRYLVRKPLELGRHGCLVAHPLVTLDEVPVKEVVRHFVPRRYHLVVVLDRQGRLLGVATEPEVIGGLLERGLETPVGDLLGGPR